MKVSSYLAIALSAVGSAEAFSYSKAYDYMKQVRYFPGYFGVYIFDNDFELTCMDNGQGGRVGLQ